MVKIIISLFILLSINAAAQPVAMWHAQNQSGCDPDAEAFIAAAGITDATQRGAICTLVMDLKGASLWTKFYAIYPFVGGTASAHKWNLKDARDLDAAFRLTFMSGSGAHSSDGWIPTTSGGGTNGGANTWFTQSTQGVAGNMHLSYYSRTNAAAGNYQEMGTGNTGYNSLSLRFTGGSGSYATNGATQLASATVSDTRGFFVGTRTSTTYIGLFRNGSLLNSNTNSETSVASTNTVTVGIRNVNGIPNFSSLKQCAFATVGLGLTAAEVATFYTIVQNYQTTLGRQL